MTCCSSRGDAARACAEALDTRFFAALCEPVRVQIVRHLVLEGRSDIQSIAAAFPQDRSVISRHLQVLERAGLVVAQKVGRHQFFELDGPGVVDRLEGMAGAIRDLRSICCPETVR